MTELDMPLNFSMKKLDSSDKMDENMNTLLNIEGLHILVYFLKSPPPPKL